MRFADSSRCFRSCLPPSTPIGPSRAARALAGVAFALVLAACGGGDGSGGGSLGSGSSAKPDAASTTDAATAVDGKPGNKDDGSVRYAP